MIFVTPHDLLRLPQTYDYVITILATASPLTGSIDPLYRATPLVENSQAHLRVVASHTWKKLHIRRPPGTGGQEVVEEGNRGRQASFKRPSITQQLMVGHPLPSDIQAFLLV